MMREARPPHYRCGSTRISDCRFGGLGSAWLRASACPASLRLLALCPLAPLVGSAGPAAAQDPSTRITTAQPPAAKSFPKKKGGIFGPTPKIDKAAPLYLSFDGKSSQGEALVQGSSLSARRKDKARLKPDATTAEAFQTVARNALAQIAANATVLRQIESPEAVHQLRVAALRLGDQPLGVRPQPPGLGLGGRDPLVLEQLRRQVGQDQPLVRGRPAQAGALGGLRHRYNCSVSA